MLSKKDISDILEDRVTSSFGVSIGTGLLLEALFDVTTDRYDVTKPLPTRVHLTKYNYWLLNVYTLIRNILSSIKHKLDPSIANQSDVVSVVIETLKQELSIIYSLASTVDYESKVILYIPIYKNILKTLNKKKDPSLAYIQNTLKNIDLYREHVLKLDYIKEIPSRYNWNSKYNGSLLTSHFTLDLIQSSNITLLESHTGAIKSSEQFYTKFNGSGEYSRIPMNIITLYILGDKQLVRSCSNAYKKILLQKSIEKNWTYRTTYDKVLHDLRDTELKDDILGLNSY